ncbi:hypothetical protein E4K72_07200 [Oxalobacteraceae bacterium OM1]|nr:hypothetical protein E4K72_07200 [Oxalobacteraceae bacterium OM1]
MKRYPAGSINSIERADAALADVEQVRAAVQASYASEEQGCFGKFFASTCVDDAKERRRIALNRIRTIEQEANLFKRKQRVAERDETLKEHEAAAAAKAATQTDMASRNDVVAAEAADEQDAASAPAKQGQPRRHATKARQAEPDPAEEGRRRAENVAAYQRKVHEAEARQREIEARKQEKSREREAKAAPPQSGAVAQ